MALQFRLQRKVTTINVVEGQFATFELPRGYDYESLELRLSGTVTVTTAGTAVRAEAPCQLVPRIEVVSDGRNNHYSAPMWHGVFAHHDRSVSAAADLVTAPTAAAIAAYPVEATALIDFCTPDGERPKDSNLVTAGMSLFTLRLTFGQSASMFTGPAVSAFTGAVEVWTNEIVESVDPTTGKRTMPVALRKVTTIEQACPSTTTGQEVLLPAGNLIKSIMIRTEGTTTAGEPDYATLNNLQAVSGIDVRALLSAAALRRQNVHQFGKPRQNGYHVLDFSRNSRTAKLSELWDLTQQAQPKLILDVNGSANAKVQAVVTEYLRLAQ